MRNTLCEFLKLSRKSPRSRASTEMCIRDSNRSLQLLISDEIGYGLVPIDDFEREYREFHGRVMTELAEQADCVERIVCGIPQRIK